CALASPWTGTPNSVSLSFLSYSIRPHPSSPLFPSTTLFRSHPRGSCLATCLLALALCLAAAADDAPGTLRMGGDAHYPPYQFLRSEEHTSELQSRENLVCRLLLEKKKSQLDTT